MSGFESFTGINLVKYNSMWLNTMMSIYEVHCNSYNSRHMVNECKLGAVIWFYEVSLPTIACSHTIHCQGHRLTIELILGHYYLAMMIYTCINNSHGGKAPRLGKYCFGIQGRPSWYFNFAELRPLPHTK